MRAAQAGFPRASLMEIQSFEFFLFVAGLCLVYPLFSGEGYQQVVLAVANLLFVGMTLGTTRNAWLLAGLLAGGYTAVRLLQSGRSALRFVAPLGIGALVLLFFHLKGAHADVVPSVPGARVIAMIGYSCVMFKLIHMLVDASENQLRPVRFLTYFNYLCGFWSWLAGPIQRYNDFAVQVEEEGRVVRADQVLPVLHRVVNGCLKLFVIGPWLAEHVTPAATLAAPPSAWRLVAFFYGYYVLLYVNFTGYCDIVIGAARLLGIQVPENFDRPYLARNLLDFWHRWHITLSEWLRDYVFNPTWMSLARQPRLARWSTPVAYGLTFLVQALWHGLWVNFFVFGMLHAAGCIFNRYAPLLMARRFPPAMLARFHALPVVHFAAVVATITFVAFTHLVFAWPFPDLWRVALFAWKGGEAS